MKRNGDNRGAQPYYGAPVPDVQPRRKTMPVNGDVRDKRRIKALRAPVERHPSPLNRRR